MSVIAIAGVPSSVTGSNIGNLILKHLKPLINGNFDFMHLFTEKNDKTAFLRLSEKLDPQEVVENINSKKRGTLYAYIPAAVPDVPIKHKQKMPIPMMFISSVYMIMQEMQSKYAGLFDLSASTAHKLLNDIARASMSLFASMSVARIHKFTPYQKVLNAAKEVFTSIIKNIARIIFKRLCKINGQAGSETIVHSLKLTQLYRRRYPHFTDIRLIQSVLGSIQDAEGNPRDQIHESDLTTYTIQSYVIENIPFDLVQNAYTKYLDKITLTVADHIKNLEMTPKNTSPEEIARIKIREQLQTLLPYLPVCMKHATSNYFIPQESNFYSVHIYGEPALPSLSALNEFLMKHKVMCTKRSERMYNMISLEVAKDQYMTLLDADGIIIAGSKLIIRPSNLPMYRVLRGIVKEMQRHLSGRIIPAKR